MMRILIVDDDPGTVVYLETLLRSEGHLVQTASDGTTALESAKELAPDILITDLEMPGLSGNQLAAAIRGTEWLKHVYVITLTSHGEKADKMKAFLSGASDFLVKPAHAGEILARIEVAEREIELKRLLQRASAGPPAPGTAEAAAGSSVAPHAPTRKLPAASPGGPPVAFPRRLVTTTSKEPPPTAPVAPRAEARAAGRAGAAPAGTGPFPAGNPGEDTPLAEILARARESIVAAGEAMQKPDLATARIRCRQAQASLEEALRTLGGGPAAEGRGLPKREPGRP